jgi:protein lifeguard
MYDPESNQYYQASTDYKSLDKNVRLGFIRKVFGLLCFQLSLTTLMVVVAMTSTGFQDFQRKNLGFFIFTIVMSFVIMIALMCYKDVARKVPTNYGNFSIF